VYFSERRCCAVGDIVRHTLFKPEPERIPASSRTRADGSVRPSRSSRKALDGKPSPSRRRLLGGRHHDGRDAAHRARRLNSLEDRFKNLHAYLGRLESRPAFRKASL
jgi:hypothetical protein